MSLPDFAIDHEHRAALVVGRGASLGPISTETILKCVAAAKAEAERTGLPLAFVIATYPEEGGEGAYAAAAAGIVIAHAAQDVPATVAKASLRKHRPADVPASLWSALAEAGVSFPEGSEDDDPEFPREGLFLVPAGWSIATLRLAAPVSADAGDNDDDDDDELEEESPASRGTRVLGAAAEEDEVPAVSDDLIARIEASPDSLVLVADYC